VVLTQGSGGNVTIANGKSAIVFADGGGAGAAVTDLTATFVPAGALLAANNLSDVANAGTSRTNLGVAIGTDGAGL
jgi:selenophosphate synthase